MPDVRHRVGIAAPRQRVYETLATNQGLTDFWTEHVEGDSEVGGKLQRACCQPRKGIGR